MRGRAAAQVVENDPSNVLVAALLRKRDRDAEARRAADKARAADKGKRPAEPGAAERPAKRPGGAAAEAGSSRPGELSRLCLEIQETVAVVSTVTQAGMNGGNTTLLRRVAAPAMN